MGKYTMIYTAFRALHRLFIDPVKRRFMKKLEPVTAAVAADVVAPAACTFAISSADEF